MKKNYTIVFAVIAALIALCAFCGCSSSDDDDGPSGDLQISTGEQVYNKNGTEYKPGSVKQVQTHTNDTGASYAALTVGSIDADGKLILNLPAFTQWGEVGGGTVTGLTAEPSNVKVVGVSCFLVAGRVFLNKNTDSAAEWIINYIYADRDAHIYGQDTVEGGQQELNLILKKGWNTEIIYFPSDFPSSNSTAVVGNPGAGYKWVFND
jgi:hypothetical protein